MNIFSMLSVVLLAAGPGRLLAQADFIFQPGSTTFPASHASTVVELRDHKLLAAWFGGTAEGASDVAIWAATQTERGWTQPRELVREPAVACWNPVLFHTGDGRLWLYYKFGPSPATWTGARRFSVDEGRTWSPIEHLPAGVLGPIRAKPLVLADGTVVSGSSTESYHAWAVWIERSTDQGMSWATIGPIVPAVHPPDLAADQAELPKEVPGSSSWALTEGIIQPSLVRLGGRHLRLYARSTARTGRVVIADSLNDGLTWSHGTPIEVPNPNSGIDAVALRDGRIVLLYNNSATDRTPLNLAVSSDGLHFTMFKTLESEPGEYSYPALIETARGDLEMTYTWNRKTIRHVHVSLAEVPLPARAPRQEDGKREE